MTVDLFNVLQVLAGPVAVYVAIRADLASLKTRIEDHGDRIRRIEEAHDRRASDKD